VPNSSFWSRGEKDDPTGRTAPPLPVQDHLPGQGGDPALGERFLGAGDPAARPPALGAGRGLVFGGAGQSIGVDVLLEQPGGQVAAQFAGAFFPLVEGDELVSGLGVEHEVERGRGVGQPSLAEGLALGGGAGWSIVHDVDSGEAVNEMLRFEYTLPQRRGRRNANAPVVTASLEAVIGLG
jgi:hypothetical protein